MRQTSAFSLVELSIVLVILGLLVGGILGGQSLIKAAELRSVITDIDKFKVAINAFKIKYNALPGDMPNSIDYWGAAHATPATCQTTQGTGTQTCNGDGNGTISQYSTTNTSDYEMYRMWQQLGIAGLVDGTYTGISGYGTRDSILGTNVPKSKINSAGYTLVNFTNYGGYAADFTPFASSIKHALFLGSATTGVGRPTIYPVIATEDAFALDTKIDDSKPGYGSIITLQSGSAVAGTCATTNSASTAAYALSTSGNICMLIIGMGF